MKQLGLKIKSIFSLSDWQILASIFLLRLFAQGGFFLLFVRNLPVAEFGQYSYLLSISAGCVALNVTGVASLIFELISKERETASTALIHGVMQALTNSLLLVPVALVTYLLVPAEKLPLSETIIFFMAEIVFLPLVDLCARAFQAGQKTNLWYFTLLLVSYIRLLFLIVILLTSRRFSIHDWISFFSLPIIVMGLISVGYFLMRTPAENIRLLLDFRFIQYSLGAFSQKMIGEVDKSILISNISSSSVGMYTAAQRICEMASIPLLARTESESKIIIKNEKLQKFKNLFLGSIKKVYPSIALSTLLIVFGGFLSPIFLGDGYRNVPSIMLFMMLYPLGFGIWQCARFSALALNKNSLVYRVEVFTLVINAVLNLLLVPAFGVLASAVLFSVSFILMCLVLILCLNVNEIDND